MKKSVQIFLELISAIAIYLFISSIAYGDHLVTLPLYLTGVGIVSYLFVRERPQQKWGSFLRVVSPFAVLMLIAGSLQDANTSLALGYIASTAVAFLLGMCIATVSKTYQKIGLSVLAFLLVVAVRLSFSAEFQYLIGVHWYTLGS